MCYLMLLYPCSHKSYRPMPCEKPAKKHWTGLWRTKQPACSRRVPSLQDRVCAKCHMEQVRQARAGPYGRTGDPESELTAALARLPPRYVGVEPRPRDFSASPPASPLPERRRRRPSFPSFASFGRKDKNKDKDNNNSGGGSKEGLRIEVIATHKLSYNNTTTEIDLGDAGFGGTSYRQPAVEDQQQHRSFLPYIDDYNKHSAFPSPRPRSQQQQQQQAMPRPGSSSYYRSATRPDSPALRPIGDVATPMRNTALWVNTTGRYVHHAEGGNAARNDSPVWAGTGPEEERASVRSHSYNNRDDRALTTSHHDYRGPTTGTFYSSSPRADRSGWDSPTYLNTVGSARSQHLDRPRTRPTTYRGVTFSSIGRADR